MRVSCHVGNRLFAAGIRHIDGDDSRAKALKKQRPLKLVTSGAAKSMDR